MKTSIRISIAYVVGSLISKAPFTSILAKEENRFLKISGRFDQTTIDTEECESGNKCFGMIQGTQGFFTHEQEKASIRFTLNGTRFTGSDSDSGTSFSGTVTGKTVSLYDGEECRTLYYYLT